MWHFVRGGMLCLLMVSGSTAAPALRVSADRLFIPIEINGHATEALLDSGAEMTVIDAATARAIGLETAGSAEARGTGRGTAQVRFAKDLEIRAAGIVLRVRTAAVLDLSDIAERIVGEPLHAVMGRELFDAGRFYLNIEEQRLERVSEAVTPEGRRLPLTEAGGIKQFPVRIEGAKAVWADFDLGNGGAVLIGRNYAETHGLLSDDRVIGLREGGGIGGSLVRKIVRLERVEIAGTAFRNVEAAIDPTPEAPDANIGVALLRRFQMTIDFADNALWLKPLERAN